MNWYYTKVADFGGTGYSTATVFTPEQEQAIVSLYDSGVTKPKSIVENLEGIDYTKGSSGAIRKVLLRHNRIKPKDLTGLQRGGKKGLVNDPMFIARVKELNERGYRKIQIAKELGVSYQTVDRVIAFNYDQIGGNREKALLNYISHNFWSTYNTGMTTYLKRLDEAERPVFINGFIDKLFEKPEDREFAKEALYRKLGIRGKMENITDDPDFQKNRMKDREIPLSGVDPVATELAIDERGEERQYLPSGKEWGAAIPPRKVDPTSTQYQEQIGVHDKQLEIQKEQEIREIIRRHLFGEPLLQIAKDYNTSYRVIQNLLQERGIVAQRRINWYKLALTDGRTRNRGSHKWVP